METNDFIEVQGWGEWIPCVLNLDIVLKRPRLIAEGGKEQTKALQGEIKKMKPITVSSAFMILPI